MFLGTTVKEDEEYICGELAPKPAHCYCLSYLIQTVLNVECLKNTVQDLRFLQSQYSYQIAHQKELNTCCKIRSYIQAFIKWLKVYVVLFVNRTFNLKKSPTDKCLLCRFLLLLLHLSVGCFNVMFLCCCGGEITYLVALGVQQRSIYYVFCTCTLIDAICNCAFFKLLNALNWAEVWPLLGQNIRQADLSPFVFRICFLHVLDPVTVMLVSWSTTLVQTDPLNIIMWRGSGLVM